MTAPKMLLAGLTSLLLIAQGSPASARHAAPRLVPAPIPVRDNEVCVSAMRNANVVGTSAFPPNLLNAIGRVESGRIDPKDGVLKAWPWTINAEGKGTLFDSKQDAIAGVLALRARGVTSIDVGCMQVNLAWHPDAFASLDDAFDPATNVRYAARFLRALYTETADWEVAAAYYHSKTPDLALAYQQKVVAQMGGVGVGAGLQKLGAIPVPHDDLALAWASTVSGPQGRGPNLFAANWAPAGPVRHGGKPIAMERDKERHALQEAMLLGSWSR